MKCDRKTRKTLIVGMNGNVPIFTLAEEFGHRFGLAGTDLK
jgi:hypothetical protein